MLRARLSLDALESRENPSDVFPPVDPFGPIPGPAPVGPPVPAPTAPVPPAPPAPLPGGGTPVFPPVDPYTGGPF